jgi:hypothetical protein
LYLASRWPLGLQLILSFTLPFLEWNVIKIV